MENLKCENIVSIAVRITQTIIAVHNFAIMLQVIMQLFFMHLNKTITGNFMRSLSVKIAFTISNYVRIIQTIFTVIDYAVMLQVIMQLFFMHLIKDIACNFLTSLSVKIAFTISNAVRII